MRVPLVLAVFAAYQLTASAFGADMEELRQRCEAYGAQPGSPAFMSCMKDLDKEARKQEAYDTAIADCHKLSWLDLNMIGSSQAPSWADGGIRSDYGIAYANAYPQKCEEQVRRQFQQR